MAWATHRIAVFVLLLAAGGVQDTAAAVAEACLNELLDGYEYLRSPEPLPTEVAITTTVTKLIEFNTKTQTFSMNMYLRQTWRDPRLAWTSNDRCNATVYPDVSDTEVWRPDTFVATASEIVSPDGEQFLKLFTDGTLVWSRRVEVVLFCSMEFRYYPMDVQECVTNIESYGYDTTMLRYIEPGADDVYPSVVELIDDDPGVGNIGPYVMEYPIYELTEQSIQGNLFSAVRLNWRFSRKSGRFILATMSQLYLVVAVSYIGCYVDVRAAPARVAVAVISVLSSVSTLNSLRLDVPVVPYITAMDWLYCITIVTVTMNVLEFSMVNHLMSMIAERQGAVERLKQRRIRRKDIVPSQRPPTNNDLTLAAAEVRELFDLFDTGCDGALTHNDCKLLIISAADDRGRAIDDQLVDEAVERLPRHVVFPELRDMLLGDALVARCIGIAYEPRSAVHLFPQSFCVTCAVTKFHILHFETLWRRWAPVLFVVVNIIWWVAVSTRDVHWAVCVGTPLAVVYILLVIRDARKRYSHNAPKEEEILDGRLGTPVRQKTGWFRGRKSMHDPLPRRGRSDVSESAVFSNPGSNSPKTLVGLEDIEMYPSDDSLTEHTMGINPSHDVSKSTTFDMPHRQSLSSVNRRQDSTAFNSPRAGRLKSRVSVANGCSTRRSGGSSGVSQTGDSNGYRTGAANGTGMRVFRPLEQPLLQEKQLAKTKNPVVPPPLPSFNADIDDL